MCLLCCGASTELSPRWLGSLGSWKHLLHDGPVQSRFNVIFPVPGVDNSLPFLFLFHLLLCENLIEAHVWGYRLWKNRQATWALRGPPLREKQHRDTSLPCSRPPGQERGHTQSTLTSLDLTLLGSSSSSVYTSSLLTTSCEPSSNSTYQGNRRPLAKTSLTLSVDHHALWQCPVVTGRIQNTEGLPCLKPQLPDWTQGSP